MNLVIADISFTYDDARKPTRAETNPGLSFISSCLFETGGQKGVGPRISTILDARFNLYQYDGWQFDHDAPNHLVAVSGNGHSGSFTYDGLGRCVRRTIDGVTRLFAYDGWKPVTEWSELGSRDIDGKADRPSERVRASQYDGNGNLHGRRVYGPGADELLERGDWDYGWFYYHTDRQGSVEYVLDGNGIGKEKRGQS